MQLKQLNANSPPQQRDIEAQCLLFNSPLIVDIALLTVLTFIVNSAAKPRRRRSANAREPLFIFIIMHLSTILLK